jgi:hypothetical protein
MSECLKNPTLGARVQVHFPIDLRRVDDGHKQIGIEEDQGAMKFRRCHTDDGKGMLVQLDDAADDAAIILKTSVPVGVTEHDVGSAVGAMLVQG